MTSNSWHGDLRLLQKPANPPAVPANEASLPSRKYPNEGGILFGLIHVIILILVADITASILLTDVSACHMLSLVRGRTDIPLADVCPHSFFFTLWRSQSQPLATVPTQNFSLAAGRSLPTHTPPTVANTQRQKVRSTVQSIATTATWIPIITPQALRKHQTETKLLHPWRQTVRQREGKERGREHDK